MSRKRWSLTVLALIAMVVLISACGASAPAGGGGGGDPTATAHAKAVKFAECMRSNGVSEFPDPNASGQFAYGIRVKRLAAGPEQRGVQHAIGACKNLEPAGFMPSKLHSHAAVGAPEVRSVHPRQRCARLPGPHRNWAARRRDRIGSSIPGLQATMQKCIRLNPAAVQ